MSDTDTFFSALHRGVLGVLLFVIGIVLTAVGVGVFGESLLASIGGVVLAVMGLVAFVGVIALFIEGYREGQENADIE